MAKVKKYELENAGRAVEDEDTDTLAAIDEGLRDAETDRTVPAVKVRQLLPKWTTSSSTRKKH